MSKELSKSQSGLSPKKELVIKVKKKKIKEKGYPPSLIHGKDGDKDKKYQLLCACNGGKDYTKARAKLKTQPVLGYKIDPKLRENCEICHVMPHVIMKANDAKRTEKAWEDAQ